MSRISFSVGAVGYVLAGWTNYLTPVVAVAVVVVAVVVVASS